MVMIVSMFGLPSTVCFNSAVSPPDEVERVTLKPLDLAGQSGE